MTGPVDSPGNLFNVAKDALYGAAATYGASQIGSTMRDFMSQRPRIPGGRSEETQEETIETVGGVVGTGKVHKSATHVRIMRYQRPPHHMKLTSSMTYIHSFNGKLGSPKSVGYDQWDNMGALLDFDQLFSNNAVAPGSLASSFRTMSDVQVPLFNLLQPEVATNTIGGASGATYGGTGLTWSAQAVALGGNGEFGKAYFDKIHGHIWFQNYAGQETEVTVYFVSPRVNVGNFTITDPIQSYTAYGRKINAGLAAGKTYTTGETTSQWGIENYATSSTGTTLVNPTQDIFANKFQRNMWHIHKAVKFDLQPGHSHRMDLKLCYNHYLDLTKAYAQFTNSTIAGAYMKDWTTFLVVRMRSAPVWDSTASSGMTYGPCDIRYTGTLHFDGKYIKPTDQLPRNVYVDPSIPEVPAVAVGAVATTATQYGSTIYAPAPGTGILTATPIAN